MYTPRNVAITINPSIITTKLSLTAKLGESNSTAKQFRPARLVKIRFYSQTTKSPGRAIFLASPRNPSI